MKGVFTMDDIANYNRRRLSEAQLQRDREVAAHYQVSIETVQGDMRDLFTFAAAAFDVVWQLYVQDAKSICWLANDRW